MNNKMSVLGVLLGGLIDVGGSIISNGVLVFAWYASKFGFDSNLPPQKFSEDMLTMVRSDQMLFAATFLIGSLFSILGGYIAARFTSSALIVNGALSAWLCVGMAIYGLVFGHGQQTHSTTPAIIGIPLSITLAALGGFLRRKQVSAH
jgi:MFS family permease